MRNRVEELASVTLDLKLKARSAANMASLFANTPRATYWAVQAEEAWTAYRSADNRQINYEYNLPAPGLPVLTD